VSLDRHPGTWSVLLLDPEERPTLAACRVLGRCGHDVGVAGLGGAGQARHSRHASRYHPLPDPCGPREPFRQALEAVIRAHGYQVVVAVDDRTLARLASLESLSIPSAPTLNDCYDRLTDKLGLVTLAADAQVAYPATLRPERASEIADMLDAAGVRLPVVVKAERSAIASPEAVHHAAGATVARDLPTAAQAFRDLRRIGCIPILQERVEGAVKLNAAVIRRAGRSEFRYAHRVLRENPPTGGRGVTLETIAADAGPGGEAVRLLERVCDAAGFEGLAQAELYVERSSGVMYLIEVNPRLWGSTWFAERLQQRVVERSLRLALGLPAIPQEPYPVNRRFHHVTGELSWLRNRGFKLRDAWGLATTTRLRDVFDRVDLSDPAPVLRYVWALIAGQRRLSRHHDVLSARRAHEQRSSVREPLK
jgi:hypothetical protein